MKKSLQASRISIINFLYKYELFGKQVSTTEAFENEDFTPSELATIEKIAQKYLVLKNQIIQKMNPRWQWDRLPPYIRAVLIYGNYDFCQTDKNLVINELIIITKIYAPDDSYKFVNGILETLGKEHEKNQKDKKST